MADLDCMLTWTTEESSTRLDEATALARRVKKSTRIEPEKQDAAGAGAGWGALSIARHQPHLARSSHTVEEAGGGADVRHSEKARRERRRAEIASAEAAGTARVRLVASRRLH